MTPEEIRALVKVEVRRELKQILSPIVGEDDDDDDVLVGARQAARLLGYPSTKVLYEDISDGLLRVGKEVIDRRRLGRERPRYLFDIKACKTRFKTHHSTRRAV